MYDLRAPRAELRRFIEHYWFVTSHEGPVDLRVNAFVDGRADLVFNFGAPYTREIIGGPSSHHAASNFDAQRLVPICIVQKGLVRIAGVRFRLGGVGPFTRESLQAFTNETPRPERVLGDGALALEAALREASDVDASAALLDAFFVAHLALDDGYESFARLLAAITDAHGGGTVEELAQREDVSVRQVERLFARHLGIAPKTIATVLRFQRALKALMRDPGCPLAEVAASAGYFDQAHFIKDFKRMSGGVPRGYRGYYPPEGPDDFAPNVVVFLQDGDETEG
ncbi:MAG: AraC family transcriptional regulator [Myxococcales bacterium]|nr:AraC family transcriptional regulator [Myxococcales bacterium]